MIYVAIYGMVVVTLGIFGGTALILRRLDARPTTILPPPVLPDPRLDTISELHGRVTALEKHADDLLIAVAEGIKQVDRSEKRVQASIRRARSELEEGGVPTGALDGEYEEFFGGDGNGSGALPAVPEAVEADIPSSIPGISLAQLRRARGF